MCSTYWRASTVLLLLTVVQCHCWSWSFIQEKIGVCVYGECCLDSNFPKNFTGLARTLHDKVYGQHFVHTVVDALRDHWEHPAKKPLTISFHGWPGGGKNYVATFIANHLYRAGAQSKYVHWFIGRIHFPKESLVEKYQVELYEKIKTETSKCARQLFIFDEVDKMPEGVLNAIKNVLDYHVQVEGVDYRQAVFLFLSNTGQDPINQNYLKFWEEGRIREDLKLADFEGLILKGAFNEKGGFHMSDTIKSNLIDHYIPFLPLELKHVRLCILSEFQSRGAFSPSEEHIQSVLEIMEWDPPDKKLVARTGCKRISQKVGMLVSKFYHRLNKAHSEL